MFYVKGSSYLLSFSKPTLHEKEASAISLEEEEGLVLSHQSPTDQKYHSTLVHYLLGCVDMLPAFLIIASSMSLLAYTYTILMIPTVMTATIPILNNDTSATNGTNGTNVPLDIGCPFLPPRQEKATNVHNLRPDDIRVVIGLGDSVMAGFAAKGVQDNTFFTMANLNEDRGISFAMGGDANTVTLPNILQYYSYDLIGSSLGSHLISICFGNQICPEGQYRSKLDVLNAAQSGARSLNLNHEIDYVLGQLNALYKAGTVQPTDWKLLTLFIGSNDICHSCAEPTSLPPAFGVNVLAAVERIRTSVTNVLVQIVGMMKVQDIVVQSSRFTSYCQPIKGSDFIGHDHECECSHTDANRTIMSDLFPQYNAALQGVAQHYQDPSFESVTDFAVVFQPLLINIMSFPIQAISNIDCFHPSTLAHEWLSKMLWNMMFMQPNEKTATLQFDANAQIYCPNAADRIQTL